MNFRNVWFRLASTWGWRFLTAIVCLLMLPPVAHSQQSSSSSSADDSYTINVRVNEVLLHATVRNRKGSPVTGLTRDNFQVFEDRTLQSIKHFSHEDLPVTVGLVIDNSGSMKSKRGEVIAAALAFVSSSNPQDQMFLVNFNERISFGLPSNIAFTDHPEQMQSAMSSVVSSGKTALYDAVAIALEHIKKGTRDKKVLIIVSDGADNASTRSNAEVSASLSRSNVIIYVLGIYEPDDPENRNPRTTLKALAKASGGEAFFPETLKEVLPLCKRIAHEIRNQYTLSYVPTNQEQDGSYRAIQVRAATPSGTGLSVITRLGYIAPSKPAAVTFAPTKPEHN